MKPWVGLTMLFLASCVPQPGQQPYQLSEIQVLFAENTERWTYFYGEPQAVRLGERSLALTRGPSASPLAVADALLVDGEALYREINPALPRVAQTTRTFPGLQFVVRTSRNVQSVWLFDGSWSRLGNVFASNAAQVVENRPGAPRLAPLSEAENEAVLREILGRRGGRPVVVYEIEPPLVPNRYEPAPNQSRVAALAVQYGLETELTLMPPTPNPTPRILQQGGQSAYTAQNPAAYLVSNTSQMVTLWRLATGNQIPQPATPAVDFNLSRVVAFFWGQKPTGGYSVQYVSSQLSDNTLRVTLRLNSPAPGAILTQALTSPFVLLEVPGRFTRVEFVDPSGRVLASAGN
ncbi:protease complex subunit PrcB family protein [Meiothermus sp. CFH 77666]|uniref:protease complex subunit PrcB family protein n=1 Tax=Meiothermus sp. CFH 77666 TaxID=2817942 RepID=UPI001AA03788|nr:protease complex subunit PrcB family protein [Meiothermus sp. CFH 77666]MBO1436233.1 protease complex subunit PrcB family protein [Meiothermus sp. CFH 77666]